MNGVKIISKIDLPIQLADGQIIYSIDLVKKNNIDYIALRSTQRGTPLAYLVKNDYAKYRTHVENAFVNNGDETGTNYYTITSNNDKFRGESYINNFDWESFKLKNADYILFRTSDLDDYAVAILNPFK